MADYVDLRQSAYWPLKPDDCFWESGSASRPALIDPEADFKLTSESLMSGRSTY